MTDTEDFGLTEKQFTKLFFVQPVYTLKDFGKKIYGITVSKILGVKFTEILEYLKRDRPSMKVQNLLRLNNEILSKGNLYNYQKRLWDDSQQEDFNGTIVIIRSKLNKKYAYFIPSKIQNTVEKAHSKYYREEDLE